MSPRKEKPALLRKQNNRFWLDNFSAKMTKNSIFLDISKNMFPGVVFHAD
jgi:hypothetical protein